MISTPYFLIQKDRMDELTDSLVASFEEYWENGIIGYSFKTNNLPWIISHMKEKGLWAEVVSSDEYLLAKKLGYDTKNIIFNGPVKGKTEFIEAVSNGAIVNIDSKRELEWLLEANTSDSMIGLRVNFDLEKYCPEETQCGKEDGRFGFSYEMGEFEAALEYLKKNNILLKGIHLHCSSKTRSKNIYDAIANIAVEIVRKYRLSLEYVDIGGGFFGGVPGKPSFDDYFSSVKSILDKETLLKNVNVIIEPGMCLVGASIDYVTTVVDVKDTVNNHFVLTDGSRIHVDPLMRKSGYTYNIERQTESSMTCKQTICGFTCMEGDRLFCTEDEQLLHEGDRVIFQKVGAYTMGLSPLFIQFFPAVYVNDNSDIKCVRQKWSVEDFV